MVKRKPAFPTRIVDPRSTPFAPATYRGTLPHIYKDGCTYFLTFCLADVAPLRREERKRLGEGEGPEYVAKSLEPVAVSGSCLLKKPELATVVEAALLYFQGDRYSLSAWCVMPNHVHAVVTPHAGHPLAETTQSWKSFSAHQINKILEREGAVWQRETFDHLIRDEPAFAKFVFYTENNPISAGFVDRAEDWPFSSARLQERTL
jgi:REP element-mobilizing transposase RayT